MASNLNPYKAAANVGRRIREAVDTNTKPTGRQSVSSEQVDKAPVKEWVKAVTQEVSAQARQAKDDRATKIIRDLQKKNQRDTSAVRRSTRSRSAAAATRG